jgi:hypothetical protein
MISQGLYNSSNSRKSEMTSHFLIISRFFFKLLVRVFKSFYFEKYNKNTYLSFFKKKLGLGFAFDNDNLYRLFTIKKVFENIITNQCFNPGLFFSLKLKKKHDKLQRQRLGMQRMHGT